MAIQSGQIDSILADPLPAAASRGAIGHVGLDVPPDLLLAGGRWGCHLPWRLERPTPNADQWLESSFPAWARSILEDWSAGLFDCLGDVVFTRGDDVSQRLYYYVCELQRMGRIAGPRPHIYDIARIDRPASRRYSTESLRRLMDGLEVDEPALRAGIRLANELRIGFAALHRGGRLAGSARERLVRASLFADVRGLLQGEAVPVPGRSLLLGGSPPPDGRIHQFVESCGWNVVDEFNDRNLARLGSQVPDAVDDAVQVVTDGWLRHRFLAREGRGAGERLLAGVRDSGAECVLLWFAKADEALAWQVPRLRGALQAAGVPHLVLTACSEAFDAPDRERVGTFLGGVPA